MRYLKINLIEDLEEKERKEFKKIFKEPSFLKRNLKRIIKILAIFIIVSILLFSRGTFTEKSLIKEVPKLSFWRGIVRVVIFQEHLLKGEISDRINILLLGMGGAEHEGPYLTDTIILASFKPSTKQLALLSIPRDLWVPIPGYGWGKINSANALGEVKEKDGAHLVSLVVSNIFDLPIHYFIRIDFSGFKEIVDALGGIEIYVERSFTDNFYPAPNFRYRTIFFTQGWQKMDGERALEFVRSRHGTNDENSDFARMRRQQKVLFAIKEKIEKIKIFDEPKKIWTLFNLFKKYFKTNLTFDEIIKLGKFLSGLKEEKIITKVLEIGNSSPLYSEISNGTYILKTRTGGFEELAKIAKNIFEKPKEITEKKNKEKAKIILLNGTLIDGLARSKIEILSSDFEIVKIGNAEKRNYFKTVIYDLTNRKKENELKILKERLNAEISDEKIDNFNQEGIDFVVILGEK